MSLEENIRKIVADELSKRQPAEDLISISEFCTRRKISRTTVWRAEKQGRVKLARIGRRIFINPQQFAVC